MYRCTRICLTGLHAGPLLELEPTDTIKTSLHVPAHVGIWLRASQVAAQALLGLANMVVHRQTHKDRNNPKLYFSAQWCADSGPTASRPSPTAGNPSAHANCIQNHQSLRGE